MESLLDGLMYPWDSEGTTYLMQARGLSAHEAGTEHVEDLSGLSQYLSPPAVMPSQLMTPPAEEHTSKAQIVSVSSSFFPGSHNSVSDIILRSSDIVLFYLSSKAVLRTSKAIFQEFLGFSLDDKRFREAIIDIPESSVVLNIMIHALYGLSCAKHNPPFEDLEASINRMPVYGMEPKIYIKQSTPLFDLLLSHAPIYPMQIYALAGHFDLEDLAIKTSSHLLSYNLADLTDDLAKRMGPRYLKRLMCLHLWIQESLKSIILQPPYPHPINRDCNFDDQKTLGRAWALAASYLAWDSRPDLSIHTVQSTLAALGDHLSCTECKNTLHVRIKEVITKWVKVKRTI